MVSILSQIILKGGDLMKIEDYIHMHNEFARCFGWNPIVRSDAPHEKGKTYKQVKLQTFPFILQ